MRVAAAIVLALAVAGCVLPPALTSTVGQAPRVTPTQIPHLDLAGKGQEATESFRLEAGLSVFHFDHRGERNFSAWLMGPAGERVELLVNTIGDASGAHGVQIKSAGEHLLNVEADGSWSFTVEQPRPGSAAAPGEYKGDSDAVAGPFQSSGGLTRFQLNHQGERNFAVWLLHADGSRADLLANEIGPFDGSKAVGLDAGIYYINVDADGPWTITTD